MSYKVTADWTWTQAAMVEMGTQLAAVAPTTYFDGMFIVFYTAGPPASKDRVLADYTLADLGAAGTAVTPLVRGPDVVDGPAWHLQTEHLAGGGFVPETILGALILDAAPPAGTLVGIGAPWAEPVLITAEGDGISHDTVVGPRVSADTQESS